MSHFAKVENGVVTQVIVIEQDVLATGHWGDPASWVQTSYNHRIRKQYAGIGFKYDANADVFIAPQPFPSWSLDANHDWQAPKAKPEDGLVYFWNEEKLDWEAFVNDAI